MVVHKWFWHVFVFTDIDIFARKGKIVLPPGLTAKEEHLI
jgi:hypothetical protein